MKTVRRILRLVFFLFLIVVAAAVGALIVLTATERGRENLAGIISNVASSKDRKVTIAGLDGIWSGHLGVAHVVVEDGDGPWLVLRDIAVDWSPLALLSKHFDADRLAVGRIEVARLPKAGETQTAESSGSASLPVSVDIKRIELPDIALGQKLAGAGVAELAAKGSLKADAKLSDIASSLNVVRKDGKQGSVDADVQFAPADNKLDLKLKASEPAGGIIANLLKLPNAPPVDISVDGSGPLADWSGQGTFSVDGKVVTQLSGRHQLTDKGHMIEARGSGTFEQFLPATLKPLLAGNAGFDIAGTATTDGGLTIDHATVDSDAMHAEAGGTYDPKAASDLSLQVEAKGPPIAFTIATGAAPITVTATGASARLVGSGDKPVLDVTASVVSILTKGTELHGLTATVHSDGFDIQNRSGPVTIALAADSLKTDVATLAPMVTGHVKADLAGSVGSDRIVLDKGTLTSDTLNASVTANLSLADLSLSLAMNADAAASALPPQLKPVLGERVRFSAKATRDPHGAFAANEISLTSGSLTASGTASATGGALDADLTGSLGDISPLSSLAGTPLAGGVSFALTAKGTQSAPDFSVTADSASLSAAGKAISDVKFSAAGKADIAQPSAVVSLTGTVEKQPFDLEASLDTTNGKRMIKGLSVSLGASKVSGDLVLGDTFLPQGTLTLDVPDLAPLAALAGQTVTGDIKGEVGFTNDKGVPSVTLDIASQQIARGDLKAMAIAVKGTVGNYIAAPTVSGTISATSITSGSTTVSGIGLDLTPDGAWTGFAGRATVGDIPANIAGRAKLGDGVTTIELSSGSATVKGIDASIAEPSTITVKDGAATIGRLALGIGGGTVVASGTAGQMLDLKAEIAGLPASLADTFVDGLGAAGQVDGTASVSGPAGDPAVKFDMHLKDAETSQTRQAGLGAVDLDAAGSYSKGGGVVIDKATLGGDKLTGSAMGTLNPNGTSNFLLSLASTGPSLPLTLGGKESPIALALQSLSLKATGARNAVTLDLSGTLPSLTTAPAKLGNVTLSLHSDAFDLDRRAGPFTATVTSDRIDLENPTVAPLLAGAVTTTVSGSLSPDTIAIDSGSLRGDALTGSVKGRVSLADGSIDLSVAADALSSALPSAARGVLGERAKVSATLKRDASGTVSADAVSLASGPLTATGQARLSEGKVSAKVSGALANISGLSKDAQGSISFDASAEGDAAQPDLTLDVASGRLLVAGREIAGLKLTASGKADPANPAANVALSGTVAGQALRGSAVLKTAGGQRSIDGLMLSLGPNRISGDLALDDAFVPTGTVSLNLPDIGPLAALALEKVEGDVQGTIAFTKQDGTPRIAVKATTAKIVRGDLMARDVAIDALVADYLKAPTVAGTVRAGGVTSGATTVTGIAVDLKRDGEWTGFSGKATVKDIPASAAGRVRVADGTTTVELSSAQATVRGIKASVGKPTTVTIAGGKTVLDGLAVGIGGGSATVSGTAGETLDLNVALANVPVSVANGFAPGLDAAGAVSGTIKVTGKASAPSVAYAITGSGIQTSQTRGAGFGGMSATSNGTFAANTLIFTATIGEGSGLNLKGGGTVRVAGTPDLSLDFSGDLPFGFLASKLAAQGLSLTGTANVAVQVRGSAAKPRIGGTVSMAGARFVDARTGIAVNDLAGNVTIANNVATINRLTGTLSTRGSLSASGTVGIDPASGFPADLSIKLSDGRYTDGRVVTANLSGDLTVKGSLVAAPTIAGTVNLARTVISVPDRLPSSLSALDVKHKNAPAAVSAQDRAMRPAGAAGGGGGGLNLDLTINAPSQIFVQGRGLDAELGGSLKLSGSTASPQAVGSFTLTRGRLQLLGKRLNFTQGTLTFSGSLVPYLNFTAESVASDSTVTITVSGEATDPKFAFSSVPALPQDEVLARLIFGQSMSHLSPLQIAQLADAAAQLSGAGGSSSLLQKLRSQLGVDDLDITTDEKGGTAVSAGKYLNDRTYVTIQKGDKPGSGKARIDLNVGKGVKLRGEASDAGEAKGGIFYEKEY